MKSILMGLYSILTISSVSHSDIKRIETVKTQGTCTFISENFGIVDCEKRVLAKSLNIPEDLERPTNTQIYDFTERIIR